MFDHVKFGVSDYAQSKAFFLKALEPLGVAVASEGLPTPWFVADAFGRCANHLMAGGSLRCATVPMSVPTTSTKKKGAAAFLLQPVDFVGGVDGRRPERSAAANASYGPDLDLRRYGHRVRAALDPRNRLFDGWQLPEPIAGNEISLERPVCDSARLPVEADSLSLTAQAQAVAVLYSAVRNIGDRRCTEE